MTCIQQLKQPEQENTRTQMHLHPNTRTLEHPNTILFTPNGDGLNDLFNISTGHPEDIVAVQIYNRWGILVYNSSDASIGWDGTYNDIPQEAGMFVVTIFYRVDSGITQQQVSNLFLLR